MEEILKTSKRYALQVLIIANVLMLVAYGVAYFAALPLLAPIAVSYGFYLFTACAFCVIWRKVALGNPEMLTSVYMATSGFRMLLALATLTVVYFVVGREQMLPYVVVFMIFYIVGVGHHSLFFARYNNKQ